MTLTTTINPLTGGADTLAGIGMDYLFTLAGAFQTGDQVTISFTDSLTGVQTQVGAGFATGVQLQYLLTLDSKLYGITKDTLYFCAAGDANTWNNPSAAGNGYVQLSNNYDFAEDLKALAPYQGKLAIVGRRQVQIWSVDADPSNNKQVQVLPNIGTVAKRSVQPVGDMDLYMLADNGVRSVRVRDASNNAIIADIGTPIDDLLQPLLATLTDDQKAAACGVVEPSSNRYWLYLPKSDGSAGSIYVFSYFSSASIAAWGTYSPTYQEAVSAPAGNYTASVVTYTGLTKGQRYAWKPGANEVSITNGAQVLKGEGAFTATTTTAVVAGSGAAVSFTGALSVTTSFVPTQFFVYKGQVYARAGDNVFQFGGSDNATYDNCGVTFVTPYIDSGEPATRKQFTGIDAAFQGSWQISGAFDFTVNSYRLIYQNTQPTFMGAGVPWQATGTHYSFQGVEVSSGYARFASVMCHQQRSVEK
jgi:hypothetical protein